MSAWQPIETAPKDGSGLLCYWNSWAPNPRNYGVAKFEGGEWRSVDSDDDTYSEPAYWMPLPPPPEAA